MATKWTKPISRQVTLPNGEVRIVEFTETGVTIRKPRHTPKAVTYDQLEVFDPERTLLVHTQHWGMLRATLRAHGVEYAQMEGRHRMKDVLCPHGTAFQRGLDVQMAQQKAERKGGRKVTRRR